MKIVFSRKGFDSSSGGGPSPIVDGRPVSLPIPGKPGVGGATYGDLGLGELVRAASKGALGPGDIAHHDPMFLTDGRCMFGQCGAAQSHLANHGVGAGDLFVFFGLFLEDGAPPHHRFFGYLEVAEVVPIASCPADRLAEFVQLGHPHALAMHGNNDVIYLGRGRAARHAHDDLRLTVPEGPPSLWRVPPWLRETGLSYHGRADRWLPEDRLRSVARGQEFVADVGDRAEPRAWVEHMMALIEN